MTDIAAAGAADAAARSAKSTATEEKKSGLSADFDTFLKLLTTQMKAQNPLQPLESTEFVAQLAQFSAVEQQVQTNKKLDDLLASMSETGAGALADWVGREVRAAAPARFGGEPITAFPPEPPEDEAAEATLVVRNAKGEAVAEIPFAPGEETVEWDGRVKGGEMAEEGELYRFETRYSNAQGATDVLEADVYARVVEARRAEGGGATLVLEGGAVIDADDVAGVRDPSPITGPAGAEAEQDAA